MEPALAITQIEPLCVCAQRVLRLEEVVQEQRVVLREQQVPAGMSCHPHILLLTLSRGHEQFIAKHAAWHVCIEVCT